MITTEQVTNKGQGTSRIPNKLVNEKSPYLLQHIYNPVQWYPWGEEAFQLAKKENKPIFLSIGYSTCHWCHVMAQECFEDEEVAEMLNQYFVSIKVDKEERPDIDTVYMAVCQATTGHGGWPLTILMTPDQKPFFAATFIPKNSRYGMIGLMDLLEEVRKDWEDNREDLIRTGNQIAQIMKREFEEKTNTGEPSKELIQLAVTQFEQSHDHDYGGFGNPPKFPTPHNLMFLLRYACLEADERALFMVENTLKNMYRGGIFDHIGYGFCRYSTDEKWLVPHFEKMLYDNAMLVIAYAEAYQYTKNPLYKTVAEQVLEYIRREMTDKEGGFYCAQDADSEGVEGKFYVYTPEEINSVLGNEDGSFFNTYFDISKEGNFDGSSIPNLIKTWEMKSDNEKIVRCCQKLYAYRQGRSKLHKDDKILTSWNSLMITAYATAAKVFKSEEYAAVAKRAVEFIRNRLMDEEGRLYVRYREEDKAFFGHLDDYAFFAMALLSVYEVTFEIDYLKLGVTIVDQMLDQFWDEKDSGFFLNAKDAEQLIYRPKEVYDGAIPSGNSVAAFVLQRLANLTANQKYQKYADQQLRFLAGQIKDYPSAFSFSLIALMQALYPSKEIVCLAHEHEDFQELTEYLSEHFEPNTVVLLKDKNNEEELLKIPNHIKDYHVINEKTTYYVCENHSCMAPVNTLNSATKENH
ncbi:MAG TPA: thioredoxin domain-containing protein [Clostridiales bacterium]|nr:thioredoxin domain-containing protein [Clostridiales bacterium]